MKNTCWVYIKTESKLWTVGFYDPTGKFQTDSDHHNREKARERVNYLNGGKAKGLEEKVVNGIFGMLKKVFYDANVLAPDPQTKLTTMLLFEVVQNMAQQDASIKLMQSIEKTK